MILVDTSVWIAHFRKGGAGLGELLRESLVMAHPFIIGELACGNLKNRTQILNDLRTLPCAVSATHEEVLRLIEDRKLWGLGIGWADVHLLASALLSNCRLWTFDRRLQQAAGAAAVKLYHHTRAPRSF
jgi:predicted nucleic acid-binding protein